ncbi:DNA helicase [Caerostris extrusa]|uniref:DNA helicase n=1 Tax=Caerostris extrusa TaxID=172846 RepID=A0AAV4N0B4_CAEEX|nr:DNA helicase [Caerostris extrusa]
MTCLPFNNLDEHLARFAATKKSSTTNQNTNNIKQFTFKKSLSLGRNSSSRTTVPALQSSENTRINSNSCQLLSTKSNQDPIKPVKKQGVITNFFSQSDNASKKTDFNKETNKNLNTSFLKDDFFLDDLNDFDIPSSRNENDNKNAKIIQENKSITENEKKPLFKHEKENLISGNKKYSTETCSTNSGFSEQENVSQFKQNSQNFDFIELVDLEACTELSFSDEEVKPVFTKKKKKESQRRLLSDDEDDQSANIFVSQDQILKSEDKSIDESKQNEYSANTDAVLNSLQKMNVEIMTEICDLIQDEKLHFQNEDLNILLMKKEETSTKYGNCKKRP